jgi:hypothetical protein
MPQRQYAAAFFFVSAACGLALGETQSITEDFLVRALNESAMPSYKIKVRVRKAHP